MNRIAWLVVPLALSSGCNWLSLAKNSFTYRTTMRGEVANIVTDGAFAYATLGEDGVAVLDVASCKTVATLAPPPGESSDDLALADGLLFVLDARPPGHLRVYRLGDPRRPVLVAPSRSVPVAPFSGISAAGGLSVVSGGTSQLTIWRYDVGGVLTGPIATADLGRGQPDVLIAPSGVMYVSTHYWGPYFGLDIARLDSPSGAVSTLAELPLEGAGFTEGGAKPANFPIEAALLGTDTLLVASARGLTTIDVHDSHHPTLGGTIDLGGPAVNVDVHDRVAAVTVGGERPALLLVDYASNPPDLRRVPLPQGTIPAGVALGGPRAAVAAGKSGVLFFAR